MEDILNATAAQPTFEQQSHLVAKLSAGHQLRLGATDQDMQACKSSG